MSTICLIEEVYNVNAKGRYGLDTPVMGGYDGYKVVTDTNTYYVLISNGQECCESWGYMTSDDDLNDYIGANLQAVRLTDVALNQEVVKDSGYYDGEFGGIQFVDFVTDRGTFQLAVYNSHNGYYGHGILVLKNDEVLLEDDL